MQKLFHGNVLRMLLNIITFYLMSYCQLGTSEVKVKHDTMHKCNVIVNNISTNFSIIKQFCTNHVLFSTISTKSTI